MQIYKPEQPWPKPAKKDCYFYHTMAYPDSEVIEGSWTIPDFANYIGNYPIKGKTVLDVGTATGYSAFNAEKAGALVTALDARDADEIRQVPFAKSPAFQDRAAWREDFDKRVLRTVKNSWWYGRHKYRSNIEVWYRPLESLVDWDRRFDIVFAGAIVEHISDPVSAIGYWAKVAKEAVIISFTDTWDEEGLWMRPMTDWTNPEICYAWWQLSKGLYRRVFDNLGFDLEFVRSQARHNHAAAGPQDAQRPTIIARRR